MTTVARLPCPGCGAVLRPAHPVSVGKKVKFPKCEHVFTAEAEEDADGARKEKKPAGKKKDKPAGATKAKTPSEPAKQAGDDEDGGTYGYIKESEEEEAKK